MVPAKFFFIIKNFKSSYCRKKDCVPCTLFRAYSSSCAVYKGLILTNGIPTFAAAHFVISHFHSSFQNIFKILVFNFSTNFQNSPRADLVPRWRYCHQVWDLVTKVLLQFFRLLNLPRRMKIVFGEVQNSHTFYLHLFHMLLLGSFSARNFPLVWTNVREDCRCPDRKSQVDEGSLTWTRISFIDKSSLGVKSFPRTILFLVSHQFKSRLGDIEGKKGWNWEWERCNKVEMCWLGVKMGLVLLYSRGKNGLVEVKLRLRKGWSLGWVRVKLDWGKLTGP